MHFVFQDYYDSKTRIRRFLTTVWVCRNTYEYLKKGRFLRDLEYVRLFARSPATGTVLDLLSLSSIASYHFHLERYHAVIGIVGSKLQKIRSASGTTQSVAMHQPRQCRQGTCRKRRPSIKASAGNRDVSPSINQL